jgi:hypothetical protein
MNQADSPKRRRWRWQFGLRSLLLFVFLLSAVISWPMSRLRKIARLREIARVSHDDGFVRDWFGRELAPVIRLHFEPQTTDDDLAHLRGLRSLSRLHLSNTQTTDAGLVHLSGLSSLSSLRLSNTQVTDAGLVHLRELPRLRYLHLDDTQVTGAGLIHLAETLPGLAFLYFAGTQGTYEDVVTLRQQMPECTISCDRGRRIPE